ncbi:16S rRNA (guanine(966)-N(2))-methyltransferase RsmD [Actinomadura sp. NBRC 104412]|uniref:16S rRNA (guanine(966)-N(2))-methyltransferase RsmD n=1 Tax=Actinomadura sp. NBRC 104412 TaxID=3032203 RepID=UPI0025526E78|nr:16S rRNA (guanine(966)-N(2))-methyltransferase RsmD [Actinomadura sp. NBRC 104412]
MTRVIAGSAGGRRLAVPPGRDTRPTSDRAREGLFGTVLALLGSLDGLRVADLYAGSGAVGLEALSRGAAHALLVESNPRALKVIRRNVASLGLRGARPQGGTVERLVEHEPEGGPYDLIFADPPYALADTAVTRLLEALRDHGWTVPGSLVVVERAARGPALSWPEGYAAERDRRYGEAVFWYGSATSTESASA